MKTVIEMAREAGLNPVNYMGSNLELFERFAELVRADERNRTWTQEHWTEYERSIVEAEREACARVCDDLHPGLATKRSAEIIRARGSNT
jgi:hypothetical protein